MNIGLMIQGVLKLYPGCSKCLILFGDHRMCTPLTMIIELSYYFAKKIIFCSEKIFINKGIGAT